MSWILLYQLAPLPNHKYEPFPAHAQALQQEGGSSLIQQWAMLPAVLLLLLAKLLVFLTFRVCL